MISHPAHFHMFRYTIDNLQQHGHEVVNVIPAKNADAKYAYIEKINGSSKYDTNYASVNITDVVKCSVFPEMYIFEYVSELIKGM